MYGITGGAAEESALGRVWDGRLGGGPGRPLEEVSHDLILAGQEEMTCWSSS